MCAIITRGQYGPARVSCIVFLAYARTLHSCIWYGGARDGGRRLRATGRTWGQVNYSLREYHSHCGVAATYAHVFDYSMRYDPRHFRVCGAGARVVGRRFIQIPFGIGPVLR